MHAMVLFRNVRCVHRHSTFLRKANRRVKLVHEMSYIDELTTVTTIVYTLSLCITMSVGNKNNSSHSERAMDWSPAVAR